MPDQDGLRFLFDIQDKITAKLAKIEAKSKASAAKINSAFTKASRAQETHSERLAALEEKRVAASQSNASKLAALEEKRVAQGKLAATRLANAQATEARRAENFRIAAAKRVEAARVKAERNIRNASLKTNRTFKAFSTATFAGMVSAAGAIALARKAWTTFTGLISSSFSLWGEQEQSVVAMTTALKAQGTYTPRLAQRYQDLASELQGLSTDGDETLLKMQALLVQVGDVGPDKMREALTAAQDLSVGLDVDLKTATLLVGKAFAGDVSTLSRYGIKLTEVEKKGDLAAAVLAKVQAKFGGQAAAKAETFAGVIEQLGNSWGDLKEKIGEWLTQSSGLLTPMLGKVNDAVAWLNTNFEDLKPFIAAVVTVIGVGLVGALAAAAVAIWAMVPAITAMTGGLNLIIPIIAVVAAALVGAWVKWGAAIKDFLRKVWAKNLQQIGGGLKKLSKFVGIFKSDWADAMKEAGEGLEDTAADMGKTEKATVKLAKEQTAATKVTVKATEAQKAAAKAAKKSAEAVQGLLDSWTGATLQSKEFLKAFKKLTPAQRDNDRIMKQVIEKYGSMRKILGPFDDELEDLWQTTERLTKEKKAEEKAQKAATKAQKAATKAAEAATKAADALNERLEAQRRRLLGLPTDAVIQDFEELTSTWEGLNEAEREAATKTYAKALLEASKSGIELDAAQRDLIASSGVLTKEQEKLKKEAEDLNARLEAQRQRLLGLPTDKAIQDFEELTQTWEGLNEAEKSVATDKYKAALHDAAEAGLELNESQLKLAKSSESWFSKISGGFKDMLKGITGGKGIKGVLEGIGAGITQGIGNLISRGLAKLSQWALKGLKALGKKIWGGIKRLFGGASKAEKEGRKVAAAFREGIKAGLTPDQIAEAQASWNAGWDASVKIAVRDAEIAAGATVAAATATAEAMFQALWRAEKGGPEAVQRVMASIQAILDAGGAAMAATAEEAARVLAIMDSAISAVIPAFDRAKEAGVAAYDEIYLSALKSGVGMEAGCVVGHQSAGRGHCQDTQGRGREVCTHGGLRGGAGGYTQWKRRWSRRRCGPGRRRNQGRVGNRNGCGEGS